MLVAKRSNSLASVLDDSLCSGCGACTYISPSVQMTTRSNGLRRPELQMTMTDEEQVLFDSVCPGRLVARSASAKHYDPLWGPFESISRGYSNDAEIRHSGSSGGVISECLVYLLEEHLVDAVIQTSASDKSPWSNQTVVSTSREEVIKAAGSRYAPSSPLDTLPNLDLEKRYAFVGKPCDVSALRALANKDEKIQEAFPYLISFFCAGVPNTNGAKEILKKMGQNETDVVQFRYRGNGWPGTTKATSSSGSTTEMSYDDAWGGILTKHVQFRCKVCPDGSASSADLVAADGWETNDRGYPVFDDLPGQSIVIARTEAGTELQHKLTESKIISLSDCLPDEVAAMQPGQVSKAASVYARTLGLRLLGKSYPNFLSFEPHKVASKIPLRANIRNLIGLLRRALVGRLGD